MTLPIKYKNYPFGRRNLKLEEFYRKKEAENKQKSFDRKLRNKVLIAFSVLFFCSLTVIGTVLNLKYNRESRIRATENQVKFFLYPKDIRVQKGNEFTLSPKLVISGENKKVASILMSVNFDPQIIRLTSLQTGQIGENLKNLKYTPIEKANIEGKVKIFFGASSFDNAPSGTVDLSNINFTNLQDAGTSQIYFVLSDLQVVFTDKEPAEIDIDTPVTVISENLPTPTPTFSPTLTVAPTIELSSTPSPPPSPSPSPSLSPTPVLSPSTYSSPPEPSI